MDWNAIHNEGTSQTAIGTSESIGFAQTDLRTRPEIHLPHHIQLTQYVCVTRLASRVADFQRIHSESRDQAIPDLLEGHGLVEDIQRYDLVGERDGDSRCAFNVGQPRPHFVHPFAVRIRHIGQIASPRGHAHRIVPSADLLPHGKLVGAMPSLGRESSLLPLL